MNPEIVVFCVRYIIVIGYGWEYFSIWTCKATKHFTHALLSFRVKKKTCRSGHVFSIPLIIRSVVTTFPTYSAEMAGEQLYLSTALGPTPSWLHCLMAACQDRSKASLTLVALETLLRLVEMVPTSEASRGGGGALLSALLPLCKVITPKMVDEVILTQEFVKVLLKSSACFFKWWYMVWLPPPPPPSQVVTELLWSLLSSGNSCMHVQVVSLLAWLHSLLTCHNACEMVVLEQFASQVSDWQNEG